MTQLEQLVLAVYAMGKKNGVSTDSAPDEIEPKSAAIAPPKTNTFKVNDRVRTIEDIEIGHSGEFIKPDKVGIVTLIKENIISVLYEIGEEGEMLEINFPFDKLEKIS
jgi:acetylglutamate kinase